MRKYVTHWIRAGWHKEKQDKIVGKGQKTTGENPHFVDREELASLISKVCNELDAEGYEVISIMPTLRGHSNYEHKHNSKEQTFFGGGYGWGYGWGYGYSVTDGAMITAILRR